jgi:hypothetical protein
MHRTIGDGYIVDGGKNFYADEDPPTRSATQLRHQEMNAIQEEIATVIESTGQALNPTTEAYAQMTQLNTAINAKDNDAKAAVQANLDSEVAARIAGDSAIQMQVTLLQAPEGFISGLNNDGASENITIQKGLCTAQNDKTKFIKNSSIMVKAVVEAGSLSTWVAGSYGGAVDPRALTFLQTFIADLTISSAILTDISSTAGLKYGDVLVRDNADVGYRLKRVTVVTPSTVTMQEAAISSTNNGTFTVLGRYMSLYALGKTTDASACDFVLCADGEKPDTTAYTAGGWNLYRRIGYVFIKFTNPSTPMLIPYTNYSGRHSFWFSGQENRLGTRASTGYFMGGDYNVNHSSVCALTPMINVLGKFNVVSYCNDLTTGPNTLMIAWSLYNPSKGGLSGVKTSHHEVWNMAQGTMIVPVTLEMDVDTLAGKIGVYRPNDTAFEHNFYSIGMTGFLDYRNEGSE